MKITVVDYDPAWEEKFKEEAKQIKKILEEECIQVIHIGSTAVPGLQAKPIIDMLLVVKNIEKLDQYAERFEALGYEVMGEFGIKERRYYRKRDPLRTHQIHAFQFDNLSEIQRHVYFRDFLQGNEIVREEYGALKKKLASRFPNNREEYMDGKDAFVKRVEKEALIWHWNHY